jgi:hypothetical protein
MKHLIISLIVLTTLVSCKQQKSNPTSPAPTTPPVSQPAASVPISSASQYKDRFVALATAHGITVDTSKFNIDYDPALTSGNGVLGYCSRGYNGNGTIAVSAIRLNQSYWEAWYNAGRKSELEQLMFHELGHCLLNRNHNDATVAATDYSSQVAVSIMNSYHLSSSLYEYNYTYYLNELYVLYTASAGTYNPTTTVSYNPIAVGTTPLYIVGTSNFNGGIYASTLASKIVKIETFSIQADEISPNPDFDPNKTIEDFHCDEPEIVYPQ